jgi:hypothetical protein
MKLIQSTDNHTTIGDNALISRTNCTHAKGYMKILTTIVQTSIQQDIAVMELNKFN